MFRAAFGMRRGANEPTDFWNNDHRAQEGIAHLPTRNYFSTLSEDFKRAGAEVIKSATECHNVSIVSPYRVEMALFAEKVRWFENLYYAVYKLFMELSTMKVCKMLND